MSKIVEVMRVPPPPVLERYEDRIWTQACKNGCNLLITDYLVWWRRGESEYSGVLKTHKLLENRRDRKSKNAEIAPNWNVSGTWDFSFVKQNWDFRVAFISELPIVRPKPRSSLPTTPFLDNFRVADHPPSGSDE